ncbi:Gti1/Pac2 family-domain-containing protein, partial [Mycena amicta]
HPTDIRDISDAHRVLQAVRLNILPLIKRRLAPTERNELKSGNVFVWEESDSEDGLVRWTDGKRWSQSRMRGDCLIYQEKIDTTEAEKRDKAARRALKLSDSPEPIPAPPKRRERPTKVDGLTKHTYSMSVKLPNAAGMRKWHLTAYFSARESSLLPVVEDHEYLRNIEVPRGVFGGHNGRSCGGSLGLFPLSTQRENPPVYCAISPARARDSDPPPRLSSQNQAHARSPHTTALILPPISPAASPMPLPPLSSFGYFFPKPASSPCSPTSTGTIVSPHDRRILEKFRVII